jgi:hypothetical protein
MFLDKGEDMKQQNIVLPPEKPCAVCKTLTDTPYGRNTYGDPLCSKKCSHIWDSMDVKERFEKTRERRNP